MSWPEPADYSSAVQNPRQSFIDEELRQGKAVKGAGRGLLALPQIWSGNFASVFKFECPDNNTWAVKCFTRQVNDLGHRYQAISDHLKANKRKFAVEFEYQEQGIRIKGNVYPIVKMRWVEGFTLNTFLDDHAHQPKLLEQMGQLWLRLAGELRDSQMAHGDLQHGNVLLVPGDTDKTMVLRLIDYDGMWVKKLDGDPPSEVGHGNYQHPSRTLEHYTAEIDRFAHLVIYTALRALMVGGKTLWERYERKDGLLFHKDDLTRPDDSKLMMELLQIPDPQVQTLTTALIRACKGPIDQVPLLSEVLAPSRPAATPAPSWLSPSPTLSGGPRRSGLDSRPPSNPDVPIPFMAEEAPAAIPLNAGPNTILATNAPTAILLPETKPDKAILDVLPVDSLPEVLPADRSRPAPRPIIADRMVQSRSRPRPQADRNWPLLVALLAGIPLVLLGAVLGIIRLMGSGSAPPDSKKASQAKLVAPGSLTLKGGRKQTLQLQVDRQGEERGIRIAVSGLPPLVRGRDKINLASGSTMTGLELDADPDVKAFDGRFTLTLYVADNKVDEIRVPLRVIPFIRPELQPLDPMTIEADKSVTLSVKVKRKGNTDPLTLVLKNLPDKVKQVAEPPVNGGGDEVTLSVTLKALADAPTVSGKIVRVLLLADGIEAHQQLMSLNVTTESKPIAIGLSPATRTWKLTGGGSSMHVVDITRTNHTGSVTLKLENLPEGVTQEETIIAADKNTADITLKATEAATDKTTGFKTLKLTALVNGKKVSSQDVYLLLVKNTSTTTPVKDIPRAKEVELFTGDRLTLKGTYYPSPKGKKGPAVLMVCEPSSFRNRSEYGWRALALELQKSGCGVLTFDFRGCGGSAEETVPAGFWTYGPNKLILTGGIKRNPPVGVFKPRTLNINNLPLVYRPWLVQDICAARYFLDQKHDDGELNTSNLTVIAAGEGAALSLIWLTVEAKRYKVMPSEPGKVAPMVFESRDLAGLVCLDFNTTIGTYHPKALPATYKSVSALRSLPVALIHPKAAFGRNTTQSTALAKVLQNTRLAGGGTKPIDGESWDGQYLARATEAKKMAVDVVATMQKNHGLRDWETRNLKASSYRYNVVGKTMYAHWGGRIYTAYLDSWGFTTLSFK